MKLEKSAASSKDENWIPCFRLRLDFDRYRLLVIGVAFLQLCARGAARNYCHVNRTTFTALDNSTCLPTYYEDIGQPTEKCFTEVKVLLSCLCLENTGHPPGTRVGNGRYCLMDYDRTGDYTANLTLGVCVLGVCNSTEFRTKFPVDLRDDQTAEVLQLPPLDRCTRDELPVTDSFRPLANCEFHCEGRENINIADWSPCAMDWRVNAFRQLRVGFTGRCQHGRCLMWHSQPPRDFRSNCLDQEAIMSPTGIVNSCSYQCGMRMIHRQNGLTCILNPGTFWTSATLGVCSNGTCAEIVEVHNDLPADIGNKVVVGKRCDFVNRGHLMARNDGDLCVLSRSPFTGVPQLLGVCSQGVCVRRPPFGPPAQNFRLKDCEVRNIQVTRNLLVAESCRVTCRDYRTENRKDGTPCLFRYRSYTCYILGTCQTYTVGQCFTGTCVESISSFEIHA
ncbi:uncharacterized protein LOC144144511 [Haemaphysalis longicornis]